MINCTKLHLYNFRCYSNESFTFSENINILVGDNAVGKTSVVEGIYALGQLKSHRASDDKEMIKSNESYALIKGFFNTGVKTDEIKFSISNNGKKIITNEKTHPSLSSYLGYFTPIIFCPEDLEIIKGSPSERRKFLDSNLSIIDKDYLSDLIRFKKILKQRNEFLKKMNETGEYNYTLLDIYTESLANVAVKIVERRDSFIGSLNPYIKEKSLAISDGSEEVRIEYRPNTKKNEIRKNLKTSTKNDMLAKTTTVGPHRDDFMISINDVDAKVYASQGQQRSAVLSLKLALASLIDEDGGEVIVILDDVFSELDLKRQNEILDLIDSDVQIFITTTHINMLGSEIIDKSNIIMINR